MILRSGGIDAFYIDEAHDSSIYVVTAVTVPFLRLHDNVWRFVWKDHLESAKAWRRSISTIHKIPTSKELHGTKLASGQGNYLFGTRKLEKEQIPQIYKSILSRINFLPDGSIITVSGSRGATLYGEDRLTRVMLALFQRMRMQCNSRQVNGLAYFDQGHPEYRALFRKSQVNLPTGSRDGSSRNLPLDMFVEDGNEKNSKHCLFTQCADLIAFSALTKLRCECETPHKDAKQHLSGLYDALPSSVVNLKASPKNQDGIVRL